MEVKRLDVYAEHLFRHKAQSVRLISDKPVIFNFDGHDKASSKPLPHKQLAELLYEALPPEQLDALRQTKRAEFERRIAAGRVKVEVQISGAQAWQVTLSPAVQAGRATTESTVQVAEDAAARPAAAPARPAARIAATPRAAPAPAAAPAPQPEEDDATRPDASSPAPTLESVEGEPAINTLLRYMIKVDASDLHLSSSVVPMLRLHGEMQPIQGQEALTAEVLDGLLRPIMPQRNLEQYDESNDTDFAHTIVGVARFRANIFRDRHGIGAVFRQIPFEIISTEKLGLPKAVLDLCWLSKGMVLVTGPTGSGKSTTLASLIDVVNQQRADHIITIEDPIEFVHQNKRCLVNQREISVHTQSFKAALRAALREDPDIVLVGEMRDLETVAIAIETAETGHLVFGTLHTNTAPSTVDRIIDQFPAGQQAQIRTMLAESIQAVIAQVLCKKIGGGRVAAYEILIATDAVRNLIREGKTFQLKSIMQTSKALGMQTMNDHLLEHVVEGRVEPMEAFVKSNDKKLFRDTLKRAGFEIDLTNANE